jgi:hypothetical protein
VRTAERLILRIKFSDVLQLRFTMFVNGQRRFSHSHTKLSERQVCGFTEHLFSYHFTSCRISSETEYAVTKFDTSDICLTDHGGMLKDSVGIQ